MAAMEALRGLSDMATELRQARDGLQAQAERVTLGLTARESRSLWKRLARCWLLFGVTKLGL